MKSISIYTHSLTHNSIHTEISTNQNIQAPSENGDVEKRKEKKTHKNKH